MLRGSILLLGVGVALAGTPAVAAARRLPPAADFVRLVDNPWFPLRPGTTLRYRGEQDGVPGKEVFTVTRRTRTILGVATTVVHDRVFERGRLQEDTLDYYAQDRRGVVWYLGEDT